MTRQCSLALAAVIATVAVACGGGSDELNSEAVETGEAFATSVLDGDVRRAKALLAPDADVLGGPFFASFARSGRANRLRLVGNASTAGDRIDFPYAGRAAQNGVTRRERGVFHVWLSRTDGRWRVKRFDLEPEQASIG